MGLGPFPRSPPASFSLVGVSGRSHLGHPNVQIKGVTEGKVCMGCQFDSQGAPEPLSRAGKGAVCSAPHCTTHLLLPSLSRPTG